MSVKQNKVKNEKVYSIRSYSLEGKNYTEKPNLRSTHKLFNTPEEAIEAIKNEVEQVYHNKNYRGFEIELPEIKRNEKTGDCWIYSGYFKCAYTFGPMVHYDIYINSIH